jgi:hypothetical protein
MQTYNMTSTETLMQHRTRKCAKWQNLGFPMILAFFSEKCCQHNEPLYKVHSGFPSKISDCKLLMKTFHENFIPHKPFAGYCDANYCESGGVCYVTRYLTYGVLTTLVFLPVVNTRRKHYFSREKTFRAVTHDRYYSMWTTSIR